MAEILKNIGIGCAVLGWLLPGAVLAQDDYAVTTLKDVTPLTALVSASPEAGFYYPYLLRLPTAAAPDERTWLIVEGNNSGQTTDDFDTHLKAARGQIERGVGAFAANRLGLPLLIPVFPRPGGEQHNVYTHALDSDSLDIRSGPMQRLDLQTIAMVDDAIERLRSADVTVEDKVLMIGFSASATFANRFSLIHPSRVAALAIGGFNGILMLPMEDVDGTALPYPLGLADYASRFGRSFDRDAWLAIPQLAFMGENDANDAAKFDDAYSDEDRERIYRVLGETMQPDRWQAVQRLYEASGADFRSTTYPGIGHGTNGEINTEMAEFLARAVGLPLRR